MLHSVYKKNQMHLFLNKPKSTHFSSVCNNSTVANFIFSYMNIIEMSLHTLFYMLASINEEHVSTGEARAEDSETLSECPQLLTIFNVNCIFASQGSTIHSVHPWLAKMRQLGNSIFLEPIRFCSY